MSRSNLPRRNKTSSEDAKMKHGQKFPTDVSSSGSIPHLDSDEGSMMQMSRNKTHMNRFIANNLTPPRFSMNLKKQTLPDYLSVPQPSWHTQTAGANCGTSNRTDAASFSRPQQPNQVTPHYKSDDSDMDSSSDSEYTSSSSGSSQTADSPPPPPQLDQIVSIPQPPLLRVQKDGSYSVFKANEDGSLSPNNMPRRQLHQEKYSKIIGGPPPYPKPKASPTGTLSFTVEGSDEEPPSPPTKRQCGRGVPLKLRKKYWCRCVCLDVFRVEFLPLETDKNTH